MARLREVGELGNWALGIGLGALNFYPSSILEFALAINYLMC
jgi:hypothetical protein